MISTHRVTSAFDHFTSTAASFVRGQSGARVGALGPRPLEPFLLWEFEACPFCRKVREALSILDLDALVFPCPRGGTRFRDEARARGGKTQFPFLVDPNADDRALYESDAIIAYLFARYGHGRAPRRLTLGPLTLATSALASGLRLPRGRAARPSRAPDAPLELFAHEASPDARLVREVLCELELPHLSRSCAEGSPTRDALRTHHGDVALPFLHDPSAGVSIHGARDVIAHLERTYALPA